VLPYQDNVVKIHWGGSFHGSGCYLGGRLVLAAAHQFEGLRGRTVTVELRSGERLPARLIESDAGVDGAVIQLDSHLPRQLPTVRIAESVSVGDRCYSFGWGYADTLKCSTGTVLEIAGGLVRTTSDVRSGDSGGPLFLADGTLCGPMVGAPNWRGGSQVNSTLSVAVSCRPLRQLLLRIDAWKRTVGLGCLAPPLPGPVRPPAPITPHPDPCIFPPVQPVPPVTPPEIDYDLLIERMAADPRFRGTAGPQGPQGSPGVAGTLALSEVDLKELADKIGPLLDKITFQMLDQNGNVRIVNGEPQEYKVGPGDTQPFQFFPVGSN
jgi:hypothetical protein